MNKRSVKKPAARTSRNSVVRKSSTARKTVSKTVTKAVARHVTAQPEAAPAAAITVPGAARTSVAQSAALRSHKFRVGQTVLFTSSPITRPGASGTYKVVSLLPSDGDDYQYRIKNSDEAFERVAKESQLENEH